MDPKPNDMLTCPYNKSHRVERYRMQFHVEKCRKQHMNSQEMVTCPFDSTHIVNIKELDYHVMHCNKRVLFDQIKFRVEDGISSTQQVPKGQITSSNFQNEENWDEEFVNNFKPDPSKKGAHIITKIKGATPSERRKARMEAVKNYRPLPEDSNKRE